MDQVKIFTSARVKKEQTYHRRDELATRNRVEEPKVQPITLTMSLSEMGSDNFA